MRSGIFSTKLLLSAGVIVLATLFSCNNSSESKATADTTKVTTETGMPPIMTDTSSAPSES